MNILYVTPLWSGFKSMIYDGRKSISGMPAFIYPLKALIEKGHRIDFIIATPNHQPDLNIGPDWLKNSEFHIVPWKLKGAQKIASVFRLYLRLKATIRKNSYDFIYGQGSIGSLGCVMANRYDIPCAQRLYGTFLAAETEQRHKFLIALKHPLEYLAFQTPKSFLLITNDGTKGDQVFEKIGAKGKYEFLFWLNGVELDFDMQHNNEDSENLSQPYLLFPARIVRWKQQHIALDILEHLHKQNIHSYLYYVGHIGDNDYWSEITSRIKEKKLENFVFNLGVVEKETLMHYMHGSTAVLSTYQVSNLGNVVLETLATGSIVVAINDGSLDGIIENGENGILFKTTKEAANNIAKIIENCGYRNSLREKARKSAASKLMSWEKRTNLEIDYIENSTRQQNNHQA